MFKQWFLIYTVISGVMESLAILNTLPAHELIFYLILN